VLEARAVIELVFLDASGSTGAVTLHISTTSTYAQADAAATALASVLVSMTGGVLVRQRIKYSVVRDPSSSAAIGSSIKRRGAMFFSTVGLGAVGMVEVPGITDSVLVTSGPTDGYAIDLSNSDISAFSDALIDNQASDPFGDAFEALLGGYVQSRV